MRWFNRKKKDNKVCGYLDYNGKFHKNKNDRDLENLKLDHESIKNKIRNNIEYYIRRSGDWNLIKNSDEIVEIIKHWSKIPELIEYTITMNNELDKINQKILKLLK